MLDSGFYRGVDGGKLPVHPIVSFKRDIQLRRQSSAVPMMSWQSQVIRSKVLMNDVDSVIGNSQVVRDELMQVKRISKPNRLKP